MNDINNKIDFDITELESLIIEETLNNIYIEELIKQLYLINKVDNDEKSTKVLKRC